MYLLTQPKATESLVQVDLERISPMPRIRLELNLKQVFFHREANIEIQIRGIYIVVDGLHIPFNRVSRHFLLPW